MENNGPNRNQPNNGGNNNKKNGKNGQTMLVFVLITLVFLLLISFVSNKLNGYTDKEISYTKFLQMVEDGEIEKVSIGTTTIKIEPKKQTNSYYKVSYHTGRLQDDTLLEKQIGRAHV